MTLWRDIPRNERAAGQDPGFDAFECPRCRGDDAPSRGLCLACVRAEEAAHDIHPEREAAFDAWVSEQRRSE